MSYGFFKKAAFGNPLSVLEWKISFLSYEFGRILINPYNTRGSSLGVMANLLDCDIIVSEFKLQSCYYIHFQAKAHGKCMNLLFPFSNGLNYNTTVLLQGWLWHYKVAIKQMLLRSAEEMSTASDLPSQSIHCILSHYLLSLFKSVHFLSHWLPNKTQKLGSQC